MKLLRSCLLPLLLFLLLISKRDLGQCPFTTSLTGSNLTCNGGDLTVNAANTLAKIVWYKDGAPISTIAATSSYSQNGITVAGGNGSGTADNQFAGPFGIYIDGAGNMYIADYGNNRVLKWAPGATSGIVVAGGNGAGAADNQLSAPTAVYVDGNGNIFISDGANYRVQKWAPGATSGITVAGDNGSGTADNQFGEPRGMDMDAAGNLYVADLRNDRVQKWAPGATSGVIVAGGNGRGVGANQLSIPVDVKLDADGNIYVADAGNNRVQKWAPGAASGITVAGNGFGSAADQFADAECIYIDANKNVFVADDYNARVQEWAPGASSGITVAGGNGQGEATNQLHYPVDVTLDAAGNLYVVNLGNSSIQKFLFSSIIDNQYTATSPGSYTASVTDANGCTVTTNAVVIEQVAATLNSTGGNCQGSAMLNVNTTNTLSQIVWKKDGTDVNTVNAINMTYQPVEAGLYTASITTDGGCTITTNAVIINPVLPPGVSVNASATTICAGSPVTFTATPANGGITPAYQWQVNGINAGTNATIYTDGSLTNGAVITCVMTSNATCPATPTATSTPLQMVVNPAVVPSVSIIASAGKVCSGQSISFTAATVNEGPDPGYAWRVNGTGVSTSGSGFTSNSLQDGDKVDLILSSDASCLTSPTATSNVIPVSVVQDPGSMVTITASAPVCAGTPVSFTAVATNRGNAPVYQWQVNGTIAGGNSPYYTDSHPVNGDIIICSLKSTDVCPAALSNSIPLTVNTPPVVEPGQVFPITQGQSITLNPAISGDNLRYSWSPATGLSDVTIPDPVADPAATTIYHLEVTTPEGCEASGDITVKVFTQLRMPNAFTPNGDGKNDIFYIKGGPAGSMIRDFAVFNRWGQKIFQVHDVAPGDPNYGWKGDYQGALCPPGTYVYMIGMVFGDGTSQVIKGTVILVR